MNYKEWLEKTIGDMLVAKNDKLKLKVYEQSNARYDGGNYDCTIIINGLGGTTDADVEVVPIQLMCLSGGQIEVDEEGNTAYDIFYDVLKEFCKTYNMKSNVINNFDYYKHNYVQPFPINPLEQDSATFRINFVVSGSLTITREVNDITKLLINDIEIPFINVTLSYFTSLSPSQKMNTNFATNVVQSAGVSLQVQMYHRINVLTNTARAIREHGESPNKLVDVTLEYTNGNQESLGNMIIESLSLPSDRLNPSVVTISLVKGGI